MEREYYLGLDMGTGSVGWAVTNPEYEILRAHGKALWGVRLFDSANTAEDRRMHRTARRRRDREKWRIQILQELFAEEISKKDPGFFLRMKESRYTAEDKQDENGNCPELPYALFVDKDYTDKDYHKEYPTIYHLRKMLMETNKMPDIRLVYLAFHHMMKHRGHFLLSGDIKSIKDFRNVFLQFLTCLKDEELDFSLDVDEEEIQEVEKLLKNRQIPKSEKKKQIIKLLNAKTKCEKAVLSLIVGSKVKLSEIFSDEDLNEGERPSICFSDSGYDDYAGDVESDLAEKYIIIESAKAVYDWAVLADILGEHTSLSEAKIEVFEKHKSDLKILKTVVRKYMTKEEYDEIFVSAESKFKNYPSYIGMTKINGKKKDIEGKRSNQEEFYKYIKSKLKNLDSHQEEISYILNEIEKETFLPKQVNQNNSVLPYQVHLYELSKILDNLQDKSSFIEANKDKIIELFKFRIPYYVGPLNVVKDPENPKFTWAKRKTNDKIYPWNFEDVIDVEESAQRFIRRMTNKCTYLYGEDVLPKDSLLYSKFMVLNELNNVRVNGDKLSVDLKQKIYEEVFKKSRKVTIKKLQKYLQSEGVIDKSAEITGVDGDFKGSLTAYHDFKQKLTGVNLSDKEKEEIILNIVLFGEDKKLLKKRIQKRFSGLTEGQIKSICSLSYQGWGRLSDQFLEGITAPSPETGEVWTIIRALWETNDNLMQLLSERYLFKEAIEEHNQSDKKEKLSYQTIEDLYVSPAIKRPIWQTLQIVKEVEKVMGKPPKRVFVEVAREKDKEKKRTVSRKSTLIQLYKKCKDEERQWVSELEKFEDNQLRGDRLYLYYTQKGRCMYSGEKINLEDLWDNNKYDIDHIYPQAKVMDDSLNNRVLVKRENNAVKSDVYPLAKSVQDKMKPFWKELLKGDFITKEKYQRLVRTDEFTQDELAGFIARQLVETRQSTKIVAELLKQEFPGSEIVYAKAQNVSKFRQDFEFIKVRDMNDLHHAKDAYLNIVVGNAYYVKFTKDASWYKKDAGNRSYNLNKMFLSGYDIKSNGETAWVGGKKGTIYTVNKMLEKNNILVTRKVYEVKGELFDLQLMKKGKGQLPVKSGEERLKDIRKYGGYNKITGAYYMLVESEGKKGKTIRTIEAIPLYLRDAIKKDENVALEFLREKLNNPRIIISCIKTDTLFKINGFPMNLSGRTGKQLIYKCASQLVLSNSGEKTIKKIMKYIQRLKDDKTIKLSEADKLEEKDLINLYDEFCFKLENTIYNKRPNNQLKTLYEGEEKFKELVKEEQCIVLFEILHLFQCRKLASNLELIKGSGHAGIILLNNNITDVDSISIINQSPTGIFEQEIDLKTV